MGKLLSVKEYAERMGKDGGNVRRMIIAGRLSAVKVGNQWVIDEDTPFPADKRFKENKTEKT